MRLRESSCVVAGLVASWCFFAFTPKALSNTLLQGRVEQIFNNSEITLPIALRATQLKLQMPSSAPHILQAELKSFPVILRGDWKGDLRVTQFTCSQLYATKEQADAEKDRQILTIGKRAESLFRFYTPRVGLLTLAPPVVRLPRVESPQGERDYVYLTVPEKGSERYQSSSGANGVKETLRKNEVRMLSSNVVEQDLVIERLLTDRGGKQTNTFVELVYRFTKAQPFELSVQVAEVEYGSDGRWWSKLLLEGEVR
jgi:hypothetical protein